MTRFRTRRMEPEDGPALNDTYNNLGVKPYRPLREMERIWRETGCYGYNVTPTVMASSVTDFVDQVVPILQKNGVYRTEYEGTTFRENLGL